MTTSFSCASTAARPAAERAAGYRASGAYSWMESPPRLRPPSTRLRTGALLRHAGVLPASAGATTPRHRAREALPKRRPRQRRDRPASTTRRAAASNAGEHLLHDHADQPGRLHPRHAGGREADAILRKCVHCGFCTATCPTYQVLGDELDGPRGPHLPDEAGAGRAPATAKTQLHLDRCLTCRACETTCPSGVRYGRLVDIGRPWSRRNAARRRRAPGRAGLALTRRLPRSGCSARRCVSPGSWSARRRDAGSAGAWPAARHARRMIALRGCVQPSRALDQRRRGARARPHRHVARGGRGAGCCGAVRFHLNDQEDGRDDMRAQHRRLVAARRGAVEAIVMTASGCGVTVKDYGHAARRPMRRMPRGRAHRALTRDRRAWSLPSWPASRRRVAMPGARRVPLAVHAAARPADPRQGGGLLRASATSWCRCAMRTCAAARPAPIRCCSRDRARLRRQARRAGGRRAAGHRHGQHRLPGPSRLRHGAAGAPLDRAARRSAGVESSDGGSGQGSGQGRLPARLPGHLRDARHGRDGRAGRRRAARPTIRSPPARSARRSSATSIGRTARTACDSR